MSTIEFRIAEDHDLPIIIKLLADDELGKNREDIGQKIDASYVLAFKEILEDSNNELLVGILDSKVVAVLQITYIPNLTLKGTKRALIEGVRVDSDTRGLGIGQELFGFAFNRAKGRGCKLVQLTTNKSRGDAIRFYERIGFVSTHEGMKKELL